MNVPESILEKLTKLLAFKEDAERRGEEAFHELQNITSRISEILLKYNLEMSDAIEAKKRKEEKIGIEEVQYKFNHRETGWLQKLWHLIAESNLCKAIMIGASRKDQQSFFLIGFDLNRELVKFIVPQLENRIRIMAKSSWKDYSSKEPLFILSGIEPTTNRNTFLRSFYNGAISGLAKKLYEEKEKYETQISAMIKRTDLEIKNFVDKIFDDLKKSKDRGSSSYHGYSAGFKAGSKLEIRQGLNESQNKTGLLK